MARWFALLDVSWSVRPGEILGLFPPKDGRTCQRRETLAVGRALLAAPRFLILAEPSAGLAPRAW